MKTALVYDLTTLVWIAEGVSRDGMKVTVVTWSRCAAAASSSSHRSPFSRGHRSNDASPTTLPSSVFGWQTASSGSSVASKLSHEPLVTCWSTLHLIFIFKSPSTFRIPTEFFHNAQSLRASRASQECKQRRHTRHPRAFCLWFCSNTSCHLTFRTFNITQKTSFHPSQTFKYAFFNLSPETLQRLGHCFPDTCLRRRFYNIK